MLSASLLFFIAALTTARGAVVQSDPPAAAVKVNVYYESRCPFSVAFFNQQLLPVYAQLGDAVLNVTLVPYGKEMSEPTPWERNDYVCQHGLLECMGNNLHACYLLSAAGQQNTQNTTLNFINCQMDLSSYPGDLVRKCACEHEIITSPIEQCAYDQHVYPLFADVFANATFAVQQPVVGVPFITIDGVQQDDSVVTSGFLQAVCAAYKGAKPPACN